MLKCIFFINRLIPRTRQNERVRRRIENNRNHNSVVGNTSASTLSTDITRSRHMVTSSTSRTPKKRTKRRKTKKSSQKIRYRTVYEVDKVTGETVARKKRMKKKSRRSRNCVRQIPKPKTVKKRLAQQLGICAPRTSTQNHLPDVKIPNVPSNSSNNISGMRHSAGIPALHLFGHTNELDYFSEDNEDYSLGSQVLIRRAPNQSDISTMRRTLMRKNLIVPPEVVSSSSDLLGSILNTQEQFFARNASYSLDSSGKFKVETKKSKSNYIDVTKEQVTAKETPYYPNNNNNNNRNYNNRYNQNYRYNQYNNRYQNQRQSNNYYSSSNQNNYYNSEPSSSMNYGNFSGGGDENDIPQDYSQRTLCATAESNLQGNDELEETGGDEGNNANSESELDIYSDIETVTTSRAEENDPKPPSPPIISHTPNTGTDEDNNDSDGDMVIDDEKVQEQEPQNICHREEAAVTSTVGITGQFEPSSGEPTNSSMEIQSEAVQSSSLDEHKYQYYNDDSSYGCPNASVYSQEVKPSNDEENDSDDGCPNFSIYSKESKTLALHTDITTDRLGYRDYQVGEISSSPNIEEQGQSIEPVDNNPQDSYDPEQIYNSEPAIEEIQNKSNPEQVDPDQSYDPEKIYDQNDSPEGDNIADQTYDPETCLHQDESTEIDKEDADQSYDPEKIYDEEESIDKTCDYEKEVFKYNSSVDKSNSVDPDVSTVIGDRYDPAVPFSDDLDESQVLDKKEAVPSNQESDTEKGDDQSEKLSKETKPIIKGGILGGLYSDSEDDESVVKNDSAFAIADINHMTEDISEEERSYTPCLDEKFQKQGLEGLDTEMISDEERNDFDESHELKTVSDGGDALEINAKESELDFTRPEDYEEGEIVDKNKDKDVQDDEEEEEPETEQVCDKPVEEKKSKKKDKDKEKERTSTEDKTGNKENEASNNEASFKKLSKSNKDRNYRDKEKRHSRPKSRSKDRDYNKKDRKKEKRKELERYNVRAIIAEKPRPLIAKDQFGRDIRTTPSQSRSRSYTPPIRRSTSRPIRSPSKTRRSLSRTRRSLSRRRKSPSIDKSRKRRKSKNFRSPSRSRSRSPIKKNSPQKSKKRKRSTSRYRKRKSGGDSGSKNKKRLSRRRSRSATPVTRTNWERREWSPMSQNSPARASPSWTPPRRIDNSQLLRNENLTVTVNNSKKKRDKRRKGDKRNKESLDSRQKKRRRERERTPPPSKEVFASGDNILVSVSFNNDNETRDVSTRDKRKSDETKKRKEKKKKNRRDISGIKPVAIIDLDRSPFRELTPSPKQIIVLTDSDNEENDNLTNVQNNICDSSQQVASPERGIGPKTPPEPQVKFSLTVKPPQVRAINNPLHDPEDMETNDDHVEDEISSRMGPGIHIGPNTPPDPPNSPPSSPDAYDPFEPTKSRSPTPERQTQSKDNLDNIDGKTALEILDKSNNPMPEVVKSLTPPLAEIQPADSQSSIQVTPDSNLEKSPDRTEGIQMKPVAQTIPFSSVPSSIITSTPIPSNIPASRINILNSTIITPPVASSIPQRIVLPNQIKSSPVKISPTKFTIKSNPIKPIPNKNNKVLRKRNQNEDNIILDFDSPYSPGSSDYEDLFEPPSDIVTKPVIKGKPKQSQKHNLTAFDALFGCSPNSNMKQKKNKLMKKNTTSSKTKTVGVKLDEDNLKILDDLPNSAVEMQVKDKVSFIFKPKCNTLARTSSALNGSSNVRERLLLGIVEQSLTILD